MTPTSTTRPIDLAAILDEAERDRTRRLALRPRSAHGTGCADR